MMYLKNVTDSQVDVISPLMLPMWTIKKNPTTFMSREDETSVVPLELQSVYRIFP